MNAKLIYIIILSSLLELLGGCIEVKNKGARSEEKQLIVENRMLDIHKISFIKLPEHLKVEVRPLSTPKKYSVFFSWPIIQEGFRLRFRQNRSLGFVESSVQYFSNEVYHHQNLVYYIDVLDKKDDTVFSHQVSVFIPRDYVVGEDPAILDKNMDLEVSRFFLSSETPFQTMGFDFYLKAQEIIIDGDGTIETFPALFQDHHLLSENWCPKNRADSMAPGGSVVLMGYPTAKPNQNGRSGGTISIEALKISGHLKVGLRGQKGGRGVNAPENNQQGAKGPDRQSSVFNGGYCTTVEPGYNGANGPSGFEGGKGFLGGDSGNLFLKVKDGSQFKFKGDSDIEIKPGPGGDGGCGGVGGPGGPGGGNHCARNLRINKWMGDPGSEGPVGPKGVIGSSGDYGKICLTVESAEVNWCHDGK